MAMAPTTVNSARSDQVTERLPQLRLCIHPVQGGYHGSEFFTCVTSRARLGRNADLRGVFSDNILDKASSSVYDLNNAHEVFGWSYISWQAKCEEA